MKQASTARESMESPAGAAYDVTPTDDTAVGTYAPRALYVGTGGDLAVVMADQSSNVTFKNVPSGSILPVRVWSVQSTDTTATDILALY